MTDVASRPSYTVPACPWMYWSFPFACLCRSTLTLNNHPIKDRRTQQDSSIELFRRCGDWCSVAYYEAFAMVALVVSGLVGILADAIYYTCVRVFKARKTNATYGFDEFLMDFCELGCGS